jgi:hypothetical protein
MALSCRKIKPSNFKFCNINMGRGGGPTCSDTSLLIWSLCVLPQKKGKKEGRKAGGQKPNTALVSST